MCLLFVKDFLNFHFLNVHLQQLKCWLASRECILLFLKEDSQWTLAVVTIMEWFRIILLKHVLIVAFVH